MSISVGPHTSREVGLELWLDSYQRVSRWMNGQFPHTDEQELHDAISEAWHEICAKGIHTTATPQARSTWKTLSKLRQYDKIRARNYRNEHGLGSVHLSDELGEVLGHFDHELQHVEERDASDASALEFATYLDTHLTDLEQQYFKLAQQGITGRRDLATQLGVSMATLGRVVTSTRKVIRRFYCAREAHEFCIRAGELVEVLVAEGRPGIVSHPSLRMHLAGCPRCQLLASTVPRELRGVAPVLGTAAIGSMTATTGAGIVTAQGAGGVLAGLGAAKIVAAGVLAVSVATGAAALDGDLSTKPHKNHPAAVQSARVRTITPPPVGAALIAPTTTATTPSSGSFTSTTTTEPAKPKPVAEHRTTTRSATPRDVEALTGPDTSTNDAASDTGSAEPSASTADATGTDISTAQQDAGSSSSGGGSGASAGDVESAFGLGGQ